MNENKPNNNNEIKIKTNNYNNLHYLISKLGNKTENSV